MATLPLTAMLPAEPAAMAIMTTVTVVQPVRCGIATAAATALANSLAASRLAVTAPMQPAQAAGAASARTPVLAPTGAVGAHTLARRAV